MIRFKQHNENKLVSLGIGQKQIITSWLDEMKITNYVINDDFTIDVNDYVDLSFKNLVKFPRFIKFNKVSGSFSCRNNNLTSLEGCPTSVNENFSCRNNNLTSLEGCPTSVGIDFYCNNNKKKFTKDEVRKLCKVENIIYN